MADGACLCLLMVARQAPKNLPLGSEVFGDNASNRNELISTKVLWKSRYPWGHSYSYIHVWLGNDHLVCCIPNEASVVTR